MRSGHHDVEVETVLALWSVGVPGLGPREARPEGVSHQDTGVWLVHRVQHIVPRLGRPGVAEPQLPCGRLSVGDSVPGRHLLVVRGRRLEPADLPEVGLHHQVAPDCGQGEADKEVEQQSLSDWSHDVSHHWLG